jgi:hypothetical protein
LSYCRSERFNVEAAYKSLYVCKGLFIGQGRIKGASVEWNRQQRRESALAWAHSSWNLLAKLERSLLLVQVPFYLFTCCIPWQKHGEVFLGQGKYAIKILQKFGMMDCKSMDTPMTTAIRKVRDSDSNPVDPSLYRQSVGSLMYLVNTWPDICFFVNTLSQFQVEPIHEHWIAAKHVLRYIRGTLNYGLRYTASSDIQLHGFTNSDWPGSVKDRRSTSGMCFSLGSAMISWGSRKQKSIALSTTEAKYIAACEACTKEVWLRKLIYLIRFQIRP